jgi:hypothetical protein
MPGSIPRPKIMAATRRAARRRYKAVEDRPMDDEK